MPAQIARRSAAPAALIAALTAAALACQPPSPLAPEPGAAAASSEPLVVPPPPDADGDGVPDAEDACPAEAGMRDSDARKSGCRPADSDGDGVIDARDRCPSQAIAESADRDHDGCMDDSDGDGLADDVDDCPRDRATSKSTAENKGCPRHVRVTATQIVITTPITFDIGKPHLRPEAMDIIEEIAEVLSRRPEIRLVEVQGHGPQDPHRSLSITQRRAESVMKALIVKGVDPSRLYAKGYGDARPLADPRTDEGKRLNRRIELWIQTPP